MKEKLVPIISIVIGLLAFLMSSHYLQGQRDKLEEAKRALNRGTEKIVAVVAKEDLPRGATITRGNLALSKPQFKTRLPDDVIIAENSDHILNRRTRVSLRRGRAISWSDIEKGTPSRGLSPVIRHGMRAVSLSIGGAAAVSGMIQPNDRLDIIGTFSFPSEMAGEMKTVTLTILQDVSVLAVGQQLANMTGAGARRKQSRGYNSVTLEVTPPEAELLIFAQQTRGQMALILRHPEDSSFEKEIPIVDFEHLQKKIPEMNETRQYKVWGKARLR